MLRRRRGQPAGNEHGAVLILTSLLLVVLLGFAALAVDAANAWSNRRHSQNAADFAALAAVQAIPYTLSSEVGPATSDKGTEFVEIRNAPGATATVDEPTGDPPCLPNLDPTGARPCLTDVAVQVEAPSDNAFAQVIGADGTLDVLSTAQAHIEIAEPALRLFPLGVDSPGGRSFRCLETQPILGIINCVTPVSVGLPDLPPPLPSLPPIEILGSTDVDIIGLWRNDAGCSDAVSTTNTNFIQGADHLVGTDASKPALHEHTACDDGHALSMPNQTRRLNDQRVPPLLTGGIQPLLGGPPVWEHLEAGSGGLFCTLVDLLDTLGLGDVLFAVQTLVMAGCVAELDPANTAFVFDCDDPPPQLGWALDITATGTRYEGYMPVWIHSLLDSGIVSSSPSNPTGFTVFVLSESMLPECLVEPGPGGFENLTFKLVD